MDAYRSLFQPLSLVMRYALIALGMPKVKQIQKLDHLGRVEIDMEIRSHIAIAKVV